MGGKFICVEEAAEEFTDFILIGGSEAEEAVREHLRRKVQEVYRKYSINVSGLNVVGHSRYEIPISELSVVGHGEYHINVSPLWMSSLHKKIFEYVSGLSIVSKEMKDSIRVSRLNVASDVMLDRFPVSELGFVKDKFIYTWIGPLSIVKNISIPIKLHGLDIYISNENKLSKYLKYLKLMKILDAIDSIDEI